MTDEVSNPRRTVAIAGLVIALGLLLPGLFLNVITVRGVLQPSGVADIAPKLLDQGISEEAAKTIRPLINPAMLPLLESMPGGLRGALVNQLTQQLTKQLKTGTDIEVYRQERSIVSAVRYLYRVESYTAATLILLFSVVVPFVKMLLVLWAVYNSNPHRRARTLRFVEIIAKWSMADVFAVALFITYLAAQASQSVGTSTTTLVTFTAAFGPGFYWFAAYCLFSLFTQQITHRWLMARS